MKTKIKSIFWLGIAIILLSIVDAFSGFVANIPIIGGILTSLSNTLLEFIDIAIGGLIVIMTNKFRR